jgi:hypothetical protein
MGWWTGLDSTLQVDKGENFNSDLANLNVIVLDELHRTATTSF